VATPVETNDVTPVIKQEEDTTETTEAKNANDEDETTESAEAKKK
jgi:hypothetical protein